VSKEQIRTYFRQIAPQWDYWRNRNRFYHYSMRDLIRGMVPPNADVLEFGSGSGDLLADLQTSRGVGLNLAQELTDQAGRKHPHLKFLTVDVDQTASPSQFSPNIIVMTNMLDYVHDVWDQMESMAGLIKEDTLLVITTNNPLWSSILRAASKLKMRVPESPRNFITNQDICSVLRLHGFDIVEEGLAVPIPKNIPIISGIANALLPELPILRFSSSIQYVAARPHIPRQPLSCSVIIPCHNEAENIAECIRRVPNMGRSTEIVVVDDGSTDDTAQQVQDVMRTDPRVRLIVFDQNQGKANAVRAGFDAAKGDIVMILDADMAVMPEDLPKFVRPLQQGTADFVNGTRLVYPMEGQAMKMINYLGNKAFCYLASWVMRQRVSDSLCGTKALFKRDCVRMPIGGKERWGDFDFLFGAARLRLRVLEVPVHYQERRAGHSKMRVLRDGWLFLKACMYGWRMLRFPNTMPWPKEQDRVSGWREVTIETRRFANIER
jgi:ubiquinone/menaquinone biosynthesis C-methylase UbiE